MKFHEQKTLHMVAMNHANLKITHNRPINHAVYNSGCQICNHQRMENNEIEFKVNRH